MSSLRSFCFLAFAGLALTACPGPSGDTPRQFCENFASALCQQVYSCFTPAEIAAANLPATESACVTTRDANIGCAAQTPDNACTGGNQTFDGVEAAKCTDQVMGATCAEIRAFFLNNTPIADAPACDLVCAVH